MLTAPALAVLTALRDLARERGAAPPRSELAKRAGVEAADLDAIADELRAAGLIARLSSACDPKWLPTVVTIAGHQLLGEIHAAPAEVAAC